MKFLFPLIYIYNIYIPIIWGIPSLARFLYISLYILHHFTSFFLWSCWNLLQKKKEEKRKSFFHIFFFLSIFHPCNFPWKLKQKIRFLHSSLCHKFFKFFFSEFEFIYIWINTFTKIYYINFQFKNKFKNIL